jgi:hypothetical protein
MNRFGYDETNGTVIGSDTVEVYEYHYNGKHCDTRAFRTIDDAKQHWHFAEKTSTAILLRHTPPVIIVRATRAVAA